MTTKTIKTSAPKRTGRPSLYTPELGEKICKLIAEGKSERLICEMPGMPKLSTLWTWKDKHPEFLDSSVRARAASAEHFNDEVIRLSDELQTELSQRIGSNESFPKGTVEAYKVLMQEAARQAAMRDDRNFGNRKSVALTGADGGAVKIEAKTEIKPGMEGLRAIMAQWQAKSQED